MRIRLINLDRSQDRLAEFKASNPDLRGIERVSAVDGKMLDRPALIQGGFLHPSLKYSDGALGCALSHLAEWNNAVERDEAVTVVEDDAVLCANFVDRVEEVIQGLGEEWEYIMWGFNFDAPLTYSLMPGISPCIATFRQDQMRRVIAGFSKREAYPTLFPLLRGFGTVCYSVSPRGARRLIQHCLPLRPMNVVYPGFPRPIINSGIDQMMADIWPHMQAYVSVPPLALTANDHGISTVLAPKAVVPTSRAAQPAPAAPSMQPQSPGESFVEAVPKVRSFDLFDTLVARRCVTPKAVFAQIEHETGFEGFARRRVAAEQTVLHRDYTFDHIYEALAETGAYTPDQIAFFKEKELATEWENIFPIAEHIAEVRPADLIISDMYLPRPFVEKIVAIKAGLPFNRVVLSSGGKHTGRIWPTLQENFPIVEHLGDNPHSDVASPNRAGIRGRLTESHRPTLNETILADHGFPALARAIRVARLESWHADPTMRWLQLAQIGTNFPVLALASVHLARKMLSLGYSRALFSARDCEKWSLLFPKMLATQGLPALSSQYFFTSRVSRSKASPGYLEYLADSRDGQNAIIADICGTGWSLSRLLDKAGYNEREVGIYLIHHLDDFPVNTLDQAYGANTPRSLIFAITNKPNVNNLFEMLNVTDHPMVRDVTRLGGRHVPLFADHGHNDLARPIVQLQKQAFLEAMAAWELHGHERYDGVSDDRLLKAMDLLYGQLSSWDGAAFTPLLRQQRSEETLVNGLLGALVASSTGRTQEESRPGGQPSPAPLEPSAKDERRVIVLAPALRDKSGRHYNNCLSLLEESRRLDARFHLLCNAETTDSDIGEVLNGRPYFSFSQFQRITGDVGQSVRLANEELLRALLALPVLGPNDVVIFPSVTASLVLAIAAWLESRTKRPGPVVCLSFVVPDSVSGGDRGLDAHPAYFTAFATALRGMRSLTGMRLFFTAETHALCERLQRLSGLPVEFMTPGIPAGALRNAVSAGVEPLKPGRKLRLGFLGATSSQKGAALVPEAVRILAERHGRSIEFVVRRETSRSDVWFSAFPGLVDAYEALRTREDVVLIDGPLDPRSYFELLNSVDILALPYDRQDESCSSSLFWEGFAMGKVLVLPLPSSMAGIVAEMGGGAAGFERCEPISVADAVTEALEQFAVLDQRSKQVGQLWRHHIAENGLMDRLAGLAGWSHAEAEAVQPAPAYA